MAASEETKVAVMQQQIEYIKNQVDIMIAKLDEQARDNSERFVRIQDEMDLRVGAIHKRFELKADQKEVDKITTTLSRINWIIITSVLLALMALIVNVK